MKPFISFLIIAYCFFHSSTAWAYSSTKYYLEGTVYESNHPENSIAIINGEPYKTNNVVGDYRVTEIYANGVLLRHLKNSQEMSLLVGRDAPPKWFNDALARQREANKQARSEESLFSRIFINPFKAVNLAREAGVKAALMQIKVGLEVYYAEEGRYPDDLAVLQSQGYVQENLHVGRGGYTFHYKSKGVSYELWADPDSKAGGRHFFFLDDSGILRVEEGSRASRTSPIAD